MSVSIKDIAQAAGVSPSTVSRALHDHPRISQETKTRIHELARELGYTPSYDNCTNVQVDPGETVVLFNTGTGLKYPHIPGLAVP